MAGISGDNNNTQFSGQQFRSNGSEQAKCDLCSTIIYKPGGYQLTTTQVVCSPRFWQCYYQHHRGEFAVLGLSSYEAMLASPALSAVIEQITNDATPWLIGEECIDYFEVDRGQARAYACQWWDSGRVFVPPGSGPASRFDVNMAQPGITPAAAAARPEEETMLAPMPSSMPSQKKRPVALPVAAGLVVAGLILAVAGGVFFFSRITGGSSTGLAQTPLDKSTLATQVAATIYADQTVQAFTPTPTQLPAHTPTAIPTATPTHTPTNTPGSPADSPAALYDDFDTPAFDGAYNQEVWSTKDWNSTIRTIAQQNGNLIISQTSGPTGSSFVALTTAQRNYYSISELKYVQADFMLNDDFTGKFGMAQLGIALSDDSWWLSCQFEGYEGYSPQLGYSSRDKGHTTRSPILVSYNTWHTVRVEIKPDPVTFDIYFDGVFFDTYVPDKLEAIRKGKLQINLGAYLEPNSSITVQFDNVQIGR
jgi:hypothetical protein